MSASDNLIIQSTHGNLESIEDEIGYTINPTLPRRDYDVPGKDSHLD